MQTFSCLRMVPAMVFALIAAPSLTGAGLLVNCSAPTINLTPSSTSGSGVATCQQFNPALGTLVGYTISGLSAQGGPTFSGTYTILNNTGSALTGSSFFGPVVSITFDAFPGQTAFTGNGPLVTSGPVNIPVGGTQTLSGSTVVSMIRNGNTSLASYIGTGTFMVPFTTSFLMNAPGSGTLQDFNLSAYGGITVGYIYNEVPEPSGMVAAGVAALVLTARRRVR
jgi:hypothetical protein